MPNVSPVTVVAFWALMAIAPIRRPPLLGFVSCVLGFWVNELPFLALYWLLTWMLLTGAQDGWTSTGSLTYLGIGLFAIVELTVIVRRASLTEAAVKEALTRGLPGAGGKAPTAGGPSRWCRRGRVLFAPFALWPTGVRLIKNIDYGPAGRRNRLDMYLPRRQVDHSRPVLIHFHGGGFRIGAKNRQSRPLLHRLTRQGWACISANYRLGAAGRFPNSLIDAKKVIAWVRSHADEYGLDPNVIIAAGSSAGAHLASMTALTANNPAFQIGFEHEDTSVTAAICLYGYYGPREPAGPLPSSPASCVRPDAPAFFIAHGDHDTLVPTRHAEHFVAQLRAASTNPVVYLELPGAQHTFDLFHSFRFESVIDGIETFITWVRANHDQPTPAPRVPGRKDTE